MTAYRDCAIDDLRVSAFKVPTTSPEADGTFEWRATTIVVARAKAAGVESLGYTYADVSAAQLIDSSLKSVAVGCDAMRVKETWMAMVRAIRNLGRPGVCSMAIAAVDAALWDLKARLLNVPLATLLGQARSEVPAYGSGGFTSYTVAELQKQLSGWAAQGIQSVKMKIGTRPEDDVERVKAAREAVGAGVRLMVDANGAYTRQQALEKALAFGELNVRWFEEPVSSDDLEGLRWLRERGPAGMEIAAGEYGYDALYFRRMLAAGAVDVLQADATRCAGVTGFLQADGLAEGFGTPLSAHTAPTLHTHLCCAAVRARDVEYFYDHARIERMFFDGAIEPVGGMLRTGDGPGLGLELKSSDVEKYKIYGDLYSSK